MYPDLPSIYFAPLEGITGHIFRNAFHECYDTGITKYFAPFIPTTSTKMKKKRERNDIDPANNQSISLIPQLISNSADDSRRYMEEFHRLGYREINFNIGCPYRTVTAKKKGAGLLAHYQLLEKFLTGIFTDPVMKISIKTRIGFQDPDEFPELLALYNNYPVHELIIHPRVGVQMYTGTPDMLTFSTAVEHSAVPICYNGDLNTAKDIRNFMALYPTVDRIMIGRGFLRNPELLLTLQAEAGQSRSPAVFCDTSASRWYTFHEQLVCRYLQEFDSPTNLLFKMKELWFYWKELFADEKTLKKIRKTSSFTDYQTYVKQLLPSFRMPPPDAVL